MLEIKEGQFAITESRWGFDAVRADKVTPKQIRTHRWGNRFAQADRSTIIAVCDTKEAAAALMDKLDRARRAFVAERSRADSAFNEAIKPAEAARNEIIAQAQEIFRRAVGEIAASADRSGEADETSTKIEGSAEGESAVGSEADETP